MFWNKRPSKEETLKYLYQKDIQKKVDLLEEVERVERALILLSDSYLTHSSFIHSQDIERDIARMLGITRMRAINLTTGKQDLEILLKDLED